MDIINPYIHGEGASPAAFDGFGNRSRSFDGVDDYISIADNADIPTGAQTICCWVKFNTLNSGASGQDLITHWTTTDSNNASFAIYMPNTSNGKVRFYVSQGGQLHVNVEALDAISALEWSHVACVFTPNDSIKIYINGSLSNTLATTSISSLYNSSVDLVLSGRDQVLVTTPLNGKLADVRLYDTDLTATEISDLYNGTNITTNLVGHWLTDADNVLDAAGSNNGTNYGTKYSYDNPSPPVEFGSASRSFNGSSDYVDCGDALDNVFAGTGKKCTFTAWIKADALNDRLIFAKWHNTLSERAYFVRITASGDLGVNFSSDGTTNNRWGKITDTSPISTNTWHHVAFSYDQTATGNYLRLWVDGVEDTTPTDYLHAGTFTSIHDGNATIQISGINGTQSQDFDGKIADVRIYDTDLTASQISDLYSGTDVQTNLVGHWLTDNDDVEDKAGTNDGTNFGSTYSYDNPPMDLIPSRQASRDFDGTSDYIATANDIDAVLDGAFTIAFWLKLDDGQPSATQQFFGVDNGTDIARILVTTGGVVRAVYSSNNITVSVADLATSLTNGQQAWVHYAWVVTPTAQKIYVDGSEATLDGTNDGDMTGVNMGVFATVLDFYIGARNLNGSPNQFAAGNYADFRIYDAELTASQISDLYNGTTDRTNLVGQWLTNSDDVVDHAGTNDGINNGTTYSTDSPS